MSLRNLVVFAAVCASFACRNGEGASAALSDAAAVSGITTIDLGAMVTKVSSASPADFATAQTQTMSSLLSPAFAMSGSIGDVVIGGHTFKKLGAYLKANQAAAKQLPANLGGFAVGANITSLANITEADMQHAADELYAIYESSASGAQGELGLLNTATCIGSAIGAAGSLIGYAACPETDGLGCAIGAATGTLAGAANATNNCHDPVNQLASTIKTAINKKPANPVEQKNTAFDTVAHH